MNRIILIGNGFDLAHGYHTRYEDFINWYWDEMGKKIFKSNEKSESNPFFSVTLNDTISLGSLNAAFSYYRIKSTYYRDFIDEIKKHPDICEYKDKSVLFSQISKAIQSKGWVDIEREYYDLLREVILRTEDCDYTISELNNHLQYIQELLTQYLSSITNVGINCDNRIHQQIYGKIRKNDISISQLPAYYAYVDFLINHADDEYQRLLYRYGIDGPNRYFFGEDIKKLKSFSNSKEIEEVYLRDLILPSNILFLNFNYTGVADLYGSEKVSTVIHIHGKLDTTNSMIFGYGDELDDEYKNILNTSNNEYLKNIKSIRYLESSNYRKMLQFIESAPYQVYIMGHSCGNSDRTLLNTLFEHKNCVSIKPYYYQKEDGSDNYMEIVQNICRNFTDMKLMRDRVVNKTFCEPLPQV